MSAWYGKYVIGLTGNIATGKSVIRKMLEHLGAYGIDADSLANRITSKGSPGYQPVIDAFGSEILGEDQEIDRARLAQTVFADRHALRDLEAIVHPLVGETIDKLMTGIREKVVVVEAIKLLESGLRNRCDSLWVAHVPEEIQLSRLVENRGMTTAVARLRIQAQPPQASKTSQADVVIENLGTFEDLWYQVRSAWDRAFPNETIPQGFTYDAISLQRIQPSQSYQVREWLEKFSERRAKPTSKQVTQAFAEKGFLWIRYEMKTAGLVSWSVENFIARIQEIMLDRHHRSLLLQKDAIVAVEQAARQLLCELVMVSAGPGMDHFQDIIEPMGYRPALTETFQQRARKEAFEAFKRVYPDVWYKVIGVDPASLVG